MSGPSNWPPEPTSLPTAGPEAALPGTKLGEHYPGCFGCGLDVPSGLCVALTVGEGFTLHGQFVLRESHQGAPGLAHGGVLTVALDEIMGRLHVLTGTPVVTVRLETEYLRPVPIERTLHLSAAIDGMRGRKLYATGSGRLDGEDGPVAVRARGLFIEVGPEHFEKHGRPADNTPTMNP